MKGQKIRSPQDIKELHRRVVNELWNDGNLDAIDPYIHPEMSGRLRAEGMSPDDAKQIVREFRDAFPDLRLTVQYQVVEGDDLATFSTMSGTHRGTFRGVEPTGRTFQVSTASFTRFSDGLIIEEAVVFDEQTILSQLNGR
jgi:predicted ester cyclase